MKSIKKRLLLNSKRALIIVNPVSGVGLYSKERKKQIKKVAQELGWDGVIVETTKKRSAYLFAKNAIKKGTKHIIACGGDGTIMEALAAVVKKPITLGVIPLGTGNLFAANLNIPLELEEAMNIALFGKVLKIDVGEANGTFFSIMAGIGIDAQIMKEAKRGLKDRFGMLAYIASAIKNMGRPSGLYQIVIDGKQNKVQKAKTIMIANMGRIQGGIEAVPAAHFQNGILKVGIVQASDIISWSSVLINAFKGNINKSSHYTLLKGKHIEIVSLRGLKPYQCDGNDFPPTDKLVVDICPKALSVIVP